MPWMERCLATLRASLAATARPSSLSIFSTWRARKEALGRTHLVLWSSHERSLPAQTNHLSDLHGAGTIGRLDARTPGQGTPSRSIVFARGPGAATQPKVLQRQFLAPRPLLLTQEGDWR